MDAMQQELRNLGFRISAANFWAVVSHLECGDAFSSLWTHDAQKGIIGKGTAVRIRKLWRSGELERLKSLRSGETLVTQEQKATGLQSTYDALGDIPAGMLWTISELEHRHVPEKEAPLLLKLYDKFSRQSVLFHRHLSGDVPFLALCFQVQLYQLYPGIPVNTSKALVRIYIQGLFATGRKPEHLETFLKYQPWRSAEHRSTMLTALRHALPANQRDSAVRRFLRVLKGSAN